jgi:hypothetical protein
MGCNIAAMRRFTIRPKSKKNERDVRHNRNCYFDSQTEDAKHIEESDREYMKRQMDARRRIENHDYDTEINVDSCVDSLMKKIAQMR